MPIATRTGGCSHPASIEYFRKNTAATTSAMPAIAANNFTPMRLSQSNAGAAGRLGGVGGGGGGAGGRGTSGGDGGRAGVADGAGPAAGGAWTGRGGVGDAGGGAVGSGRSATRGSGTDSGAGGGTGLSAAGGTCAGGATRGGTTGAAGRVGSGRAAAAGGDAGDGDGAASRDSWVTRERSSSISFSCDSTTRRSVSSRRAVLRADTQAAIGRTKGMTSGISAKKRISTVPRPRAGGAPPGTDSLVAGVHSSYTEPPSLVSSHSCRTPQAARRPREKP